MKFLRSIQGKTRCDSIRNYMFTEEVGINNFLTELEEKHWFSNSRIMDKIKIPWTLELNFKEKQI
jgi:hypothetical protein